MNKFLKIAIETFKDAKYIKGDEFVDASIELAEGFSIGLCGRKTFLSSEDISNENEILFSQILHDSFEEAIAVLKKSFDKRNNINNNNKNSKMANINNRANKSEIRKNFKNLIDGSIKDADVTLIEPAAINSFRLSILTDLDGADGTDLSHEEIFTSLEVIEKFKDIFKNEIKTKGGMKKVFPIVLTIEKDLKAIVEAENIEKPIEEKTSEFVYSQIIDFGYKLDGPQADDLTEFLAKNEVKHIKMNDTSLGFLPEFDYNLVSIFGLVSDEKAVELDNTIGKGENTNLKIVSSNVNKVEKEVTEKPKKAKKIETPKSKENKPKEAKKAKIEKVTFFDGIENHAQLIECWEAIQAEGKEIYSKQKQLKVNSIEEYPVDRIWFDNKQFGKSGKTKFDVNKLHKSFKIGTKEAVNIEATEVLKKINSFKALKDLVGDECLIWKENLVCSWELQPKFPNIFVEGNKKPMTSFYTILDRYFTVK